MPGYNKMQKSVVINSKFNYSNSPPNPTDTIDSNPYDDSQSQIIQAPLVKRNEFKDELIYQQEEIKKLKN